MNIPDDKYDRIAFEVNYFGDTRQYNWTNEFLLADMFIGTIKNTSGELIIMIRGVVIIIIIDELTPS